VRTPEWAGAQNNGGFTDEVWATRPANLAGKSPGDPSLPALMGQGGNTEGTGGGWRVVVNPDATFTYFRDNHTWASTSPIPATGYHHIAITYDGTTLRYYLDGAGAGTFTTSLSTVTDTGDLQVGNSNDNVDPDFDQGNLADVAIYTTALTAAQVSAHHTAGVTAPGTSTNYAGAGVPRMRKGTAAYERRNQQSNAVQEMEEGAVSPLPGPPGSALRERDSKPLQGASVKSRGLERCRKRQGNPCQVCTTELSESEPSMTRRKVEG